MPFLLPYQQRQSTEGIVDEAKRSEGRAIDSVFMSGLGKHWCEEVMCND